MVTFRAHKGLDSIWISTSTDGKVKANPFSPPDRSWSVASDDWESWRAEHPEHTIAVWNGINDQFWSLSRGLECVAITPPNQGRPWWPQRPPSILGVLPQWVIDALIDLGEVTTSEIEESNAVESIASMHLWKFRGMALEICMKPIMQRFGVV